MSWVSMVRTWPPRFFWTANLGLRWGGVVLERRRGLRLPLSGEPRQETLCSWVLDLRRHCASEAEGMPTMERRLALPVGTDTTLARWKPNDDTFLLKCLLKKVSIVTGGAPNSGC